jgi:hypothetical protein
MELLVVVSIVVLVSVITLPAIRSDYRERSIQEAARMVQGELVAARDEAARFNTARGIRFVPDLTMPDTCSQILPIGSASDYSLGLVSTTDPATLPAGFTLPYPCLMVEQCPFDAKGLRAEPTAWAWNVRAGDQIRITPAGPLYTVIGPIDPANPTADQYVVPVQILDRQDGKGPLDYLWLVNGQDDDRNGFIDDGWDGVDNDNDKAIDEADEWEAERWLGPPVVALPYVIRRRPAQADQTRVLTLPAGVVVDTKGMPAEVVIDATGAVTETGPYGVPSRIGLMSHEFRIHLIERGISGNEAWVIINARTGQVTADVRSP